MTTALRAFLMLKVGDGWKITVHRDLENLLLQWKEREDPEQTSGVVHLGFERPQTQLFNDLVELYAGQVLLTPSAKFGLPFGFEATGHPIGDVEGFPVYLATKGWGYLLDVASIDTLPTQRVDTRKAVGWIAYFLQEFPEASSEFVSSGIWDDGEYLQREKSLPTQLRTHAGIYRLKLIIQDKDDPCAFAKAAPPWFSERSFSKIELRVRVANVFENRGIKTVGDLARHSLDSLLGTQNFGRKSAADLLAALETAIATGPERALADPGVHVALTEQATLIEAVHISLSRIPERAADIVLRRMGLGREPQTLQQVGDAFGITRERVRQIESKTIAKLLRDEVWDDILSQKLTELLSERASPLPLKGIDVADPWFAGIGANGEALKYLFSMVSTAAKILEIGGIEYLGFLDQSQWDRAVSSSRQFLDASADRGLSLDQCKATVLAELPPEAEEFGDLLWESASQHSHFVEQNGSMVLLGHGRGADHIVQAVLASSDRPLHYSEIAIQVAERAGRDFDVRRIHTAAGNVGHLFGLGTYGLDTHVPLTPEEMTALAEHACEIVEEGVPARQWHANEILAEMVERDKADVERTTKYILDIALKRAGRLENYGRLVWGRAGDEATDAAARIEVRQAILAVLESANGPLEVDEIRLRVREMRGLDKPFQMHVIDPIVRLGPSLYGLNDRDISLKRDQQGPVLDSIVSWLEGRQSGVHQSELDDAPVLKRLGISGLALFGIASNDPRMRVSAGRYLFLDAWGEPRRESVPKAVKAVIEGADRPLEMNDILARVSERIGRPVERTAVVNCLKAVDAQFNSFTGRWSRSAVQEEMDFVDAP